MNIEHTPSVMVQMSVKEKQLQMQVDTGASVSIISQRTWKQCFSQLKPVHSATVLKTYTGELLHVIGEITVDVKYNKQQVKQLPLFVVSGEGPSLVDRNWLHRIRLNWHNICVLSPAYSVNELRKQFPELFKEGLGTVQDYTARLETDSPPQFFRPKSVLYALKDAIEQDLERMVRLGVLEKVSTSKWAAPIVPVPKSDGSVRICGDYKVTVNKGLTVKTHPLLMPDDLFVTSAGGGVFTKLDLANAYQQVLLEEESRHVVTINTHKGLYRYTRLPFGISSAPAIFQNVMDQVLQGLDGVVCYLDDILVSGKSAREHWKNLVVVLTRLENHGLRLKLSKCVFMATSVEYLGFHIDSSGLHASSKKVETIQAAPQPQNVSQLRSFLGLVNYYSWFLPKLSTTCQPLNRLLKGDTKWNWTQDCTRAFLTLKNN